MKLIQAIILVIQLQIILIVIKQKQTADLPKVNPICKYQENLFQSKLQSQTVMDLSKDKI